MGPVQARARAAAGAAVEPGDLLQGAERAAAAALLHTAEPATYTDSDAEVAGTARRSTGGKPPRAPPRGRATAAAVPGRRTVLDKEDGAAKRQKKKGKNMPGETACAGAGAQARSQHGGQRAGAGGEGDERRRPTHAAPEQPSGEGAGLRNGGALKGEQGSGPARAAARADADATERERLERKRAKKLRQKERRVGEERSEEQAALERARRQRKKQRLKGGVVVGEEPAA